MITPPFNSDLNIDITVSADPWKRADINAEEIARGAILAAHEQTGPAEVSVLLCDDEAIRILNREYRSKDQSTDTLSFPAETQIGGVTVLGDIVVSYDTAEEAATSQGKTLAHHLAHLVVHSYLHLIGFDHEQDIQAKAMEMREREILASLGIDDPYELR